MPAARPADIPLIDLADGQRIPQLGFGVWQIDNDDVVPAVTTALNVGYRAIDTAQGYDNESGVGAAIRQSGLPRDSLFITSKLRTKLLGYDEAQRGIAQSLEALGLDALDLFLIHWPCPALDRYVDAWRGLIAAQNNGLVRSIGVSNFLPEHITRIIDETGVTPVVNQIDTHPHYQQRDVRDFHAQHGIAIEAYSPLGTGSVLDDPVIAGIAERHGKEPAQVIIRWHLQEGRIVIPKSVHPDRIKANLDVFSFALDDDDMARIESVDDPVNGKSGSDPATFNDLY
jgi:2,5-diketo-D-gluconate reductase A